MASTHSSTDPHVRQTGTWFRRLAGKRWLVIAIGLSLVIMLSGAYGFLRLGSDSRTSEPVTSESLSDPLALVISPIDGAMIVANETGLQRSTDSGLTWETIATANDLDGDAVRGVAINPDDPTTLYAWGMGMGVVQSTDTGATWEAITNGLPGDSVGAFAMHSFERATLYAWIEDQGVFKTEDAGQNWQLMDEGPSAKAVQALTHSPLEGSMNTGWLYAATPEGVYLSMDCF